MDKYKVEIFGEFTYAQSITYEDLLAYEDILKQKLEEVFYGGGAEHLDFTPLGDILMLQCAFESKNLEILRDIAEEMASVLPERVQGKLLCLDINLKSYHMFWIKRGQWQEKKYILPAQGPEDLPIHKVEPLDDEIEVKISDAE